MTIKSGIAVNPAAVKIDGNSVFLKHQVLPYGNLEGVLKTMNKAEQESIIFCVSSSVWAILVVVAMKIDEQISHICRDFHLILNP